jgi:adenine-specific DNA-methyltransferase
MKYPSLENLQILGNKYDIKMTQEQIDKLIEELSE